MTRELRIHITCASRRWQVCRQTAGIAMAVLLLAAGVDVAGWCGVLPAHAMGGNGGGGHGGGADGGGGHGGGGGDAEDTGTGQGSSGHGGQPSMTGQREPVASAAATGNVMRQLMKQVSRRHGGKVLDVQRQRLRSGEVVYVFTLLRGNRISRVRVPMREGGAGSAPRRSYNFNNR